MGEWVGMTGTWTPFPSVLVEFISVQFIFFAVFHSYSQRKQCQLVASEQHFMHLLQVSFSFQNSLSDENEQ